MVLWGIVMTTMGLVKNVRLPTSFASLANADPLQFEQLVATRFLLGLAESGLFPGICFYLTMWCV